MRDSATRSKVNVNVNLYGASSRAKKLTPNALSVSTVKTNKSHRCRWQTRATQCLSACQIFRIASYGNQAISSTRPSRWIQISTVNSCLTTIRSFWHSPAN